MRKRMLPHGIGKIYGEEKNISTATEEEEISLAQTHADLVGIDERIQAAIARHNAFLRELGMAPLP